MVKNEAQDLIVCTRCGRTFDQVKGGCTAASMGEHSWWIGSSADWYRRQR